MESTRFTVDGNDYNPDLHKKPTENLETLMKALTEMLDDTSQENKETIAVSYTHLRAHETQ